MREEFLIDEQFESSSIRLLVINIKSTYPDLTPDNTLVLMVSPDYSATVAMHVAHSLSKDGEMCDILPIHIPYPDEKNIENYKAKASRDVDDYFLFSDKQYTNYLLVEAGVIRGGTYTWLTNLLRSKLTGRVITAALFENTGSKFKSDVVANYYNDNNLDLTFYFEEYNKHWS